MDELGMALPWHSGHLPKDREGQQHPRPNERLLLAIFLINRLVHAPFGRVIVGSKFNEQRMQALGFNTYRYRLVCYVLSAMLCSLAGMLLGTLSLYLCLVTVEDELFANYGLYLSPGVFTQEGLVIMGLVLAAALIAAAIPSLRVYFQAKAYNDA